jgi:DHA1 family multidrug resistance protein-like MFS transporter
VTRRSSPRAHGHRPPRDISRHDPPPCSAPTQIHRNPNLKSRSEIAQSRIAPRIVVTDALIRPLQIAAPDPAVLFVRVYTSLIYPTYYSFFEVFPLVYIDIYGFNESQLGLTFLAIIVGAVLGYAGYIVHLPLVINPSIVKNGLGLQEERLVPAIYVSFLFPIGLFVFGWSARRELHWIVSVIGLGLNAAGFNVSAPNQSQRKYKCPTLINHSLQ